MKNIFSILCMFLFFGCTQETLTVNKGDDVTLILKIEDSQDIESIAFITSDDTYNLNKADILNHNTIKYTFNVDGEDGLKTCIYTSNEIICREEYVEKGYTIKLNYKDHQLKSNGNSLLY